MENETHERYEYARNRLNQKKTLLFHFIIFLIASLFILIANYAFEVGAPSKWSIWVVTVWFFVLILHFINVYVINRFMDKNWERMQIDRLILKQERRIEQLENEIK